MRSVSDPSTVQMCASALKKEGQGPSVGAVVLKRGYVFPPGQTEYVVRVGGRWRHPVHGKGVLVELSSNVVLTYEKMWERVHGD